MGSHTLLVVSALVLCARAATVPAPAAPALQQRLAEAAELALQAATPLDNVHSEQELIDQVNEVKDIDNNLRKVPHNVDAIPVKIVTNEVQPSLKTEESTQLDDVEMDAEPEIKRVKINLKNTGEPQRQEHDSQSPEQQNDEQQSVANIKQSITDTQNVINQGFQGVSSGFQSWFANNDQLSSIQQNIQNLQLNFQTQLGKLNETIQGFWKPDEASSSASSPASETSPGTATATKGIIANVEKGLEVIETNFEYGVKSMVNGVQVLAAVKAENGTATIPTNPFSQLFAQIQNSIVEGFTNIQNNIQQYVNQSQFNSSNNNITNGFFQNVFGGAAQNIITPPGAQSDDGSGTTVRPTIWHGFQSTFQNIWNRPGQPGAPNAQVPPPSQNAAASGPIVQAIQKNPLVQGVVNLIQRPTDKPVETTDNADGANSVPNAEGAKPEEAKPEEAKPEADQKEKPEVVAGPLQQIVQRNPIMQGLAGAVHKLQTTLVNPEKPRDDQKGYGGYGGGGHSPAQGDNNNSGLAGAKSEPLKEEATAAPPAAPTVPLEEKDQSEQSVPDKTES